MERDDLEQLGKRKKLDEDVNLQTVDPSVLAEVGNQPHISS